MIWAKKKYGVKNIIAVFCDTGWEHQLTYEHILKTTKDLGVKLIILKSKEYDGMVDLAIKKNRFPSTNARFCTEELKSKPMIDWVLNQNEHLLMVQGIRASESKSRSNMDKVCRYFKYYFQPYGYTKTGKPKYHSYRKKEVLKWCEKYDDSIIRPVFNKSSNEVVNYILDNGYELNPLYKKGSKRVGCYPCIMSSHSELYNMIKLSPEWIDKVNQSEIKANSSFFPPTYIPKRFCSQTDKNGKKYPVVMDIVDYLVGSSEDLYQKEDIYNNSCMSFYGICE